ncbi:SH3 domain containing protein [Trichomonas vaginalis G3]|uniref:SH3 domain containing protein n=1 Tax=Trichomonas vaginalis (strain ATCC PRA-98 / G3) TaxID=412133 RepID=A2EAN9_TRIV3|nr:SH3-domain family [Trichomonas vaginalis G3]EAY10242.1 SH3 domain containing protein [Trichomonas vaginalis G3]KAI5487724.1 SH3-domain family [Trichomonas vaginalis G3]|eukprot:XP_001322465.1 SH3 domain containing protein [Trichomonas vaginalis G3]
MEIYDLQNIQFEELAQELEYTVDLERAMILKTEEIPKILDFLYVNYSKYINDTSNVIYTSLNKPIGLNARKPKASFNQLSSYQRLSEIFSEVATQISLMLKEIKEYLMPKLNFCIEYATKTTEEIFTSSKELEKLYQETRAGIVSNYASLNSLAKDIVTYKKKNDTAKLQHITYQYMNKLKVSKVMSRNLNYQFSHYDKFAKTSIKKLRELDMARAQIYLDFILKLSDIYTDSSLNYLRVFAEMEKKYTKYAKLFSGEKYLEGFIAMHGIFRTNLSDVAFYPPPNPFTEDHDFIMRPTHIDVPPVDYPLFVGKAIYDFDSRNINEVSIRIGETIYLYEKPFGNWVLASHNKVFPEGFVPTAAITTIYTKMGITMETKVENGEYLGIYPTAHFIIEKDDGENYIVRNIDNKVGKVKKTDILVDEKFLFIVNFHAE